MWKDFENGNNWVVATISVPEDIVSESRKTNKSVWELLFFHENIEKLLEMIKKIDEKIAQGSNITWADYGIFKHIYEQLNDSDISAIDWAVKAEFWNIYDEYRVKFLETMLLSNIRNNVAFQDYIWNYMTELSQISETYDMQNLGAKLTTETERQLFISYVENTFWNS